MLSLDPMNREKQRFFRFSYFLLVILSIILLSTVYNNELFNHHPVPVKLYTPHNVSETQNELLSFNKRVQLNIMEALASEEIMSGPIPPFKHIRDVFMVAPRVRLNLCPVPKSMSIVSMNIFCYLYNPDNFIQNNQSIPTSFWNGRLCQYTNELEGVMDTRNSFGNDFDHTLHIVRDPLSRFISGYLDKCYNSNWDCFQCKKEDVFCILNELKKRLERAINLEESRKDKYHILIEHMAPQTWYCEMKKNLPKIIFVKYGGGSDHDRMVNDLTAALKYSEVPDEHVDYIETELRKELRTKHTTEGSEYKVKVTSEFKARKELRDLFWSIFKNDYRIFEFKFSE